MPSCVLSKPSTSKLNKPDVVGRQGFEPWKPMATDLQSAPFGHLGTCPKHLAHYTTKNPRVRTIAFFFHQDDERKNKPIHARLPHPY
jgi:hypothetical protein